MRGSEIASGTVEASAVPLAVLRLGRSASGDEALGEGSATPPSNTGVETGRVRDTSICSKSSHDYRIDYLRLVIFDECENRKCVERWLGKNTEQSPNKANGCHTLWRGDLDPAVRALQGDDFWVWDFPGESRYLVSYRFWREVRELRQRLGVRTTSRGESKLNVNCTRIDVTMDQNDCSLLPVRFPMDVREYMLKGAFNHSYRRWNFIQGQDGDLLRFAGRLPGKLTAEDWEAISGETQYIGSREGARSFWRVYDEHGPLRWECECKEGKANAELEQLLRRVHMGETLGEVIRSMWIGLAVELLPCSAWSWAALGDGEIADPVHDPHSTIAGTIAAMVEQYSSPYVAINDCGVQPVFLGECRRRVAGLSRASLYRHRKRVRQVAEGGEGLWVDVRAILGAATRPEAS